MYLKYPKSIIGLFVILCLVGAFIAFNKVRFSFEFEQFFPSGDDDLEFFMEFKKNFEPDDNFLLVGIQKKDGVFDQKFLSNVLDFSLRIRRSKFSITKPDSITPVHSIEVTASKDSLYFYNPVLSANCLLQMEYPVKNIFTGLSTVPIIDIDKPEKYEFYKERILNDEQLVGSLISKDAKTLVVLIKTVDNINQKAANFLLREIRSLCEEYQFENHHLLGRAYFQTEIVRIQMLEYFLSIFVNIILVLIILYLLFRKLWGIIIAIASIMVGLLMFIGYLGIFSPLMDTMALLYPVIMIIVATSDVIHVMSKYIDELQKGKEKMEAIRITIREIGMSIFLTSTTTAIGFLSLSTSRLIPIQNFGFNAAIGVMIAYVSVVIFTTTILALFTKDQIILLNEKQSIWTNFMQKIYRLTLRYPKQIVFALSSLFLICILGITKINTNTQFKKLLPKNAKVTDDFMFFENTFSGFRPFELAISIQNDHTIHDYEVLQAMDQIENYFKDKHPDVKSIRSVNDIYKSLNRAFNANKSQAYTFPDTEAKFKKMHKYAKKLIKNNMGILVSKDLKSSRMSASVLDVGATNIEEIRTRSQQWIEANIDSSIIKVRSTGTGVIIDKNSDYVRNSLIKGLLFAIFLISLIIAVIYKNVKMLVIALIPNLFPLFIAAAILGFTGISLEAGVAIAFTIIFGIAIDDTIHLLSKFKLTISKGIEKEVAIRITLEETGKAICLTSIILFFGFFSMVFSSNPPVVTVGILISSTLVSAFFCDILIIPILLRKFL